ncbi:hypothetical protein [Kytococcus schroeteri]|uniref:hypothetical protein n=1 Tax=Kytococcus schroeteri TaxID=138300 RepID=UPI00192CEE5A|nr:hypothetical protein [Kytococcus schroeteri]
MLKKIISATVVAAALVSGPVAASADLKLYKDVNYQGLLGTRSTTGSWNMSTVANDELSSMKNETRWGVAFWHDINRSGKCWQSGPYTYDPSFSWRDNDEVSSYALGRGC